MSISDPSLEPLQVKDPVCGMVFLPERAAATEQHAGTTYYFCNPGCADIFRADPASHIPLPPGQVKDPVCGMVFAKEKAAATHVHDGVTFYFCNPGCADAFRAAPTRYLSKEKVAPPPGGEDRIYTCPMDPEVRQRGPASAPSAAWPWNRPPLRWKRAGSVPTMTT